MNYLKTSFFFLVGCLPLFAEFESAENHLIKPYLKRVLSSGKRVANAPLVYKKIILIGDNCPHPDFKDVDNDGVAFCDINVPGSSKKLQKKLEDSYINQPLTKESVTNLRQSIQEYYNSQHHPLVQISVPEQDITDGVVQVHVVESKLAQVAVEGSAHTSPALMKNYLGLKENEPIDVQQLRKNVDFMNRNPFRQVNLIYGPGTASDTTDISLLVNDRRPLRFYAGTNDYGIETIQRGRIFAGFNSSKLFNLDHFITYQYTTSYDLESFQSNTGQYTAYLPWRNVLNLYGGYSRVKADLPMPGARSTGESIQASGRYEIPLNPAGNFFHTVGFGFDFKRTNNTIEFSELYSVVGQNVNLSQFMGSYVGSFEKGSSRLDFEGEVYFSPGAMMPQESNADYATLRPGAKNHWVYGKIMTKYLQKLSYSCELYLAARGQLSSQNLLPSEQIGLGGFNTVRGYDERQLNYDSGIVCNGEIRSPAISVLSGKRNKSFKDALQILGFIDYGYGNNKQLLPGEPNNDYLLGVGPGVRYTIDPWLTARLDVGFKLHNQEIFTGGSTMWYFGFIANI